MITAVDTNVLLDLMESRSDRKMAAAVALEAAAEEGPLVICEIVYAELAPSFREQATLDGILDELGIQVPALGRAAAFCAGTMFVRYGRAGGSRERVLPDFVIAAHAAEHANRLMTRDRGFYRTYFPDLLLLEP